MKLIFFLLTAGLCLTAATKSSGQGLSPTAHLVQNSCADVPNGEILADVEGVFPITWTLNGNLYNKGSHQIDISGLAPGDYTIVATDATGATGSVTATVLKIIVTLDAQTNVSCYGGSDGSVAFSSQNDAPPYYHISPNIGQNNNGNFSGLTAGNYTISTAGCGTFSVDITQPPLVVNIAPPIVSDATCYGGANGKMVVSASGGTGAIAYSLSPNIGTQSPAGTFNGLTAGAYTLTATDASNNCTTIHTSVGQPTSAVSFSAPAVTNVPCSGGSGGQIVVSASGGTGVVTYSILPNVGIQSPAGTFKGLSAGVYAITATDDNGCFASTSQTVGQPTAVSFSAPAVTNTKCNGGMDGQIVVSASGGTGAITYSILPNVGTQSAAGTFTGLTADAYTIKATDASNCFATTNQTVGQPAAVSFSAPTVTNAKCFGGGGQIVVLASGGTGAITYSITPNVGAQSPAGTFTGLTANSYTIKATDANNCIASINQIVRQPTAVSFVASFVTNITCQGSNDGQIIVSAAGGTGAIAYSILPNVGIQSPAGTFTGLASGAYTIKATDPNGCVTTTNQTVGQPAAISFSTPTIANAKCFGGSDGQIAVSASGGTGAVTYSITPNVGAQSPAGTFTGLASGAYAIKATDANGCFATTNQTVGQPAAVTFSAPTITNIKCQGGAEGQIIVSASGGTGAIRYVLIPNAGNQISPGTFYSLISGAYVIQATDVNNCLATTSVTVAEPAGINFFLPTVTNVKCFGGSDGQIASSASGGTGTITYSILPNVGSQNPAGTFAGLAAGVYTIKATDANNCSTSTDQTVSQPAAVIFSAPTVTTPKCFGGSDGQIVVSASRGTGAITYSITPNVGTQSAAGTFTGLAAGTYTIKATDANNCSASTNQTVGQPAAGLSFAAPVVTNAKCFGGMDGQIVVSASGGTGAISYSITPNAGTQSPAGTFTGLAAGAYTIKATDANGCFASTNQTVGQPAAVAFTGATPTNTVCPGDATGQIVATATGGTGAISYSISPLAGTQAGAGVFTGLTANSYTITAKDANLCSALTTALIIQKDNIKPTARCKALTVYLDQSGKAAIQGSSLDNGSTDNCPQALSFSASPSSFTCVNLGNNTVVFTATDAAGNSSTCSSIVTVVDNLPPVFVKCPKDIVLSTTDLCAAASWTPPTAIDNCSVPVVAGNYTSGFCFPLGVTTVVYTAADAKGNHSTCSFNVTVNCSSNFDPAACYQLVNKKLGKALTTDGDRVAIYSSNQESDHHPIQSWRIVPTANGSVQIVSTQDAKKVVTVDASQEGDGSQGEDGSQANPVVLLGKYKTGGASDWKITCLGNSGYYAVTQSKSGKALDVRVNPEEDKAQAVVAAANAGDGQRWRIVKTACPSNQEGDNATAAFPSATAQKFHANPGTTPDFTIYPNPANNEAWIDVQGWDESEATLTLTDMLGRTVRQEVVPNAGGAPYRLDVNHLPPGVYLARLQTNGKAPLTKKLQIAN